MSRFSASKWICVTTCSAAFSAVCVVIAADPAPAPPFSPAPIKPTLIDFVTGMPVTHSMQVMATPKLLRPGFAGEMDNTAKGLASKIKAKEVDVPKRIKAAKYLGKVDCQEFPESQDQLVDLACNDEFEEVRLAAAKALKVQFSRGDDPTPSKRMQRRKDTCRGCCTNAKNINKLSERAFECDETGCAKEPSPRVREAIAEALQCCCCWQYHDGQTYGEPVELSPPPTPEGAAPAAPKEKPPVVPAEDGKAALQNKSNATTASLVSDDSEDSDVQPVVLEKTLPETEASLVECLQGHCPVGMAARRLDPASAEIWTNYNGHRYEFATEEAKEQFLLDPEHYAPVLSGHCVVTFAKTGEKVVGKFCREQDGRQYWFASKEIREEFKADPAQFIDSMDDEASDE